MLRAGYGLVALAVALRVVEYLHNKALWLDEANLAVNILQRDYAGLTERLDAGQGAPLLFLWAERFVADVLGPGEYALRLIPLVASLAACPLLYLFLRRMLPGRGLPIALAIFALAIPVIRYAAEVKAYATDLFFALVLYLLIVPLERTPLTAMRAITLGAVGAVSVWCAFPAVFVLAGMGVVLFARTVLARNLRDALLVAGAGALWVLSIASNYWFMLHHNAENAELRSWWLDRFMPLPPTSMSDVYWFVRTFFEMFADPLGLGAGGIGALLLILGVFALRDAHRFRLAMLIAPVGFALLASGLHVYPFMGRFLLFMAPALLVLIGTGWGFLTKHVRHRAIVVALGAVLLLQPAAGALRGVVKPGLEGIRPSFEYLRSNWKEGDCLYVYYWAMPTYRYYEFAMRTEFPEIAGQPSRADWSGYVADLEQLRGNGRVWIVLTNTPKTLVGQEDKFIVTHLDAIGTRVDERIHSESSVYLYDLRE